MPFSNLERGAIIMKNMNWTIFGKRLMALFLTLATVLTLFAGVAVNVEAAAYDSYYFPKYTGGSGSIVAALKAIGVDSSYSYRTKIAAVNNITGYKGTAAQNTKMVNLLKQGKLINPNGKAAQSTTNGSNIYFKRYTGSSGSIVSALNAIGVNSSYNYRCKIAAANNIAGYRGSASQNTQMLNLLKNGKLKQPEASASSNATSVSITYYETTVKTTLKSEPYEASSSVVSIPKNSTIMVSQNVTNKYGNLWYKALVYCNEGVKEGYIYSGKISSHTHSYESFTFNEVTYKVCRCGDVKVSANNSAKASEGKKVVAASTAALPLALGAVDGPLPIGDLIGVGILIVGTCVAHDILAPTTAELAEMITKADFDEYLKKKENVCNANSFRKVQRVGGKLKYIDKHCLDIVEAYIYCCFLGGDVYTPNENNALLLAAMHGKVTQMQRDKDQTTYFFHYHFSNVMNPAIDWIPHIGGHVFFGTNDLGEMPT